MTEDQRRRYEEYNKLGNKNVPPASPNRANAELGLAHVSILKELRVTPVGSDGKGEIGGVRVTGFSDDSLRSNTPLLDGDVIMKINDVPISSMQVMRDLVRDMDGSKGATLDVVRDGKSIVVLLVGR